MHIVFCRCRVGMRCRFWMRNSNRCRPSTALRSKALPSSPIESETDVTEALTVFRSASAISSAPSEPMISREASMEVILLTSLPHTAAKIAPQPSLPKLLPSRFRPSSPMEVIEGLTVIASAMALIPSAVYVPSPSSSIPQSAFLERSIYGANTDKSARIPQTHPHQHSN